MQIPFVKSTIFENCRNVNINMKYSVKIHGDTICNEVWISNNSSLINHKHTKIYNETMNPIINYLNDAEFPKYWFRSYMSWHADFRFAGDNPGCCLSIAAITASSKTFSRPSCNFKMRFVL